VKSDRSQQSPSPQAPQTTSLALAKNPTLKDTAGQSTQFSIKPGTPATLGEVKPDAYEYIPGQCYYRYRITYHAFDHFEPMPGKYVFTVVDDSWSNAQYSSLRDKFGVTGVVHWGGDPSRAMSYWPAGRIWQALNITHDEMQSVYNLGLRNYWFEEPVHATNLTLQYDRWNEINNGLYPAIYVHMADWSDWNLKCGIGLVYDCYHTLHDRYCSSFAIVDASSDQYCTAHGSCSTTDPVDHQQAVRDIFGSDHNQHVWISEAEYYGYKRDVLNWANTNRIYVVCIYAGQTAGDYLKDLQAYEVAWEIGFLRKFGRECTDYYYYTYLGGDPNDRDSWSGVPCKVITSCSSTVDELFP